MAERTLSQHVLSWTLPFVLAVGALLSVSTYLVARAIIVQQLEAGARQQAATAAAEVKAGWERDRNTLLTVAQSPLFVDYAKNRDFGLEQEAEVYRREIERTLLDVSNRMGYPRLRFIDAGGREVARVQDGRVQSPRGRDDAFIGALKLLKPGQASAVGPRRVDWHRWPVISWQAGIFDRGGTLLGLLSIDSSFGAIAEQLSRFRIGASGRVHLAGDRAAQPPPSRGAATATALVAGTPLAVVFTVDRGEFIRPLWLAGGATILFTFAALLLLAFGLSSQLELLLRPIKSLAGAVHALASGDDLTAQVSAEGPMEVSQLAKAFNAMVESLRQRTDDVTQSEERYRNAVENSPHAVVSLDQNMRVTLWNRRAEALFGYQPTEAFGRELSFLFSEKDFARLKRQVETEGSVRNGEALGLTRDGRRLDLNVSWTGQSSPRGAREWFVLLQDETEKKRLQAQLIQTEKLSAVGALIAGVAHELNNPLTGVVGFAEMLRQDPRADPEREEDLRMLKVSASRCKEIVQGLLSFVRQGKSLRQRISLNFLVHSTIGLVEYRFDRKDAIKLEVHLERKSPYVAGDFSRLQQILVNLLLNAADALRERRDLRVIKIRTRALESGSEVEIEDNGPGLPPEVRERLFEPFVTTKPLGVGTGLGLSISADTAREFGASLRHEDAPGGGARFVVRFPPCPDGLQEADSALNLPEPRPGTRVLIVDDEPGLAQLIRRVLAEDGMETYTSVDIDSARRVLAGGAIDLVVADIDLGPIKGFQLFDVLEGMKDRPAFLFVTGDVLNETLLQEAAKRGAPVLSKPFLRTDLLRAARRAAAAARHA